MTNRMGLRELPLSNRPWSVETYGLEPVCDGDRQGRASDLLWVWLGANLGIIGVTYGALLATFGLDIWQNLAVAVVGTTLSFVLVGVLGIAGKRGGIPMLCSSRATFGRAGNLGPALASWASLLVWEAITAVVAAYSLLALVRFAVTTTSLLIALAAVAFSALLFGRLGHATIVRIQRFVSWTVGGLTVVILVVLVHGTKWSVLLSARPGSWLSMVEGLSVVAAAGGISWANLSSDYSRYLPSCERGRSVVVWTTLGSTLALLPLVVVGVLLSSSVRGLASAPNPVAAIGSGIPRWLVTPYLITALGGLLSQMVMALYSSGLNLLVLGVRIPRSKTVFIDGVVVVGAGGILALGPHNFFAWFVSLVEPLSCGIAAWAAVLLVDVLTGKDFREVDGRMSLPATGAWVLGTMIGLATTSSPMFSGPLARGFFAESSIGYFVGFAVSGGLYALAELWKRQRSTPPPLSAESP